MENEGKNWLSATEIQVLYQVRYNQLRYWMDLGRIRYKKVGKRNYYWKGDLDGILREGTPV